MPNGTYGGVRGKETKIGRKKNSFPYLLDLLVVVGYFGKDGVEFVFITKFVVDIV